MKHFFLLPLISACAFGAACQAKSPADAAPAGGSLCGGTRQAAADPDAQLARLPKLSGRVVDGAELLSPAVEARLASELERLERRTRDQLVVVTVPGLNGEPIERFGLRLGNGWGVGQASLDNGVLLIVAPQERKVRIEVGCGLEGLLTDARAQAIVRQTLVPSFRAGEYERGVEEGVSEIVKVLVSDLRRPMVRTG